MFTSEPTQPAKQFLIPSMVKMRANPHKAARTAEGTLVKFCKLFLFSSSTSVPACQAAFLFLFSSPCSSLC